MDTSLIIQFVALLLFTACLAHSWRTEGQRAATQWFFIGYLFAILLITLLVVIQQIAYSETMIVFGAAPSLTVMLLPALLYIAYTIAGHFVDPTDLRAMTYLMFVITPWLLLPFDALAVSSGWWSFPSESYSFLNGVPFYIPFAWGAIGATFFWMMGRIRKIKFRGNGQFFAMIIATPLLAGIDLLVVGLIQVIVDTFAAIVGDSTLYLVLLILFLLLPLALFFNIPHIQPPKTRIAPRKK